MGSADDGSGISLIAHAAAYFDCPPSWRLAPRSLPHYQLWVITGGMCEFRLGGLDPVRVGPRSVIMIPPQTSQQAWNGEPSLRTHVAHFMAYDRGEPRLDLWPPTLMINLHGRAWDRVVADVRDAAAELARPRPGGTMIANAALTDAVGRLPRTEADSVIIDPSGETHPPEVAAAIDHLRRNFERDLSTRDLAAAAHVSPELLRRLFRRATGQSPSRFVQRFRIGVARRLLQETDLPVSVVARRAGFGDAFYFSRVFTAAEGTPPSRYRATARAELSAGP